MMSGMKKILGLAGAALLAGTFAVSAASLSVVGGSPFALKSSFNPTPDLSGLGLMPGTMVNVGGTLETDKASNVTVTFLGKEAGATDYFVETIGLGNIRNKLSEVGTSITFTQGMGAIKFLFETLFQGGGTIANGGAPTDPDMSMAFSSVFNSGKSVYAFFDDGSPNGAPDRDYDDMIVQIDIQAIPLPAGGLLLLTGLAGLAAARRRKV